MGRVKGVAFGVGHNDANYQIVMSRDGKEVWRCPFYVKWYDMLRRCYSERELKRYPTYQSCYVCEEWLTFSNFKSWMKDQNYSDRVLDKDILKVGNKEYCPEACRFVHPKVNGFVLDSGAARGKWPLGVFYRKDCNKFYAMCSNPMSGKRENLGVYATPDEAHLSWKARKHELACLLADSEYVDDTGIAEALRNRYKI